jgi:aspartyl-tRNA synthetase
MFKLLGMNLDQARQDFGFLLKAQNLGFPPHGGIALGLDRLIMLFGKTESIRDVIPFPKTQSMRCLMMDTPSPVSDEQLSELELKSTYVPEE